MSVRAWHSRHYLPHYEAGERPQAITFRLADSLPKARLLELKAKVAHLPAPQAARELNQRIQRHLDAGSGEGSLGSPAIGTIVQDALLFFDGTRCRLHAWVVMPNHVHLVLTPIGPHSLSSILHSLKSFTSKEANRLLGRSGVFWQPEYFDRLIRDERHFEAAVDYVENNPVAAGLCWAPEDWPFGSASLRARGRDARAPRGEVIREGGAQR